MKFSFEYLWKCLLSGLVYIPVTLRLALIPLFIALFLGTLIALARIFKVPVVEKVFKVFVAVYSGIPLRFFNLSDFEKNHNSSGDSCRPSKPYQQHAWSHKKHFDCPCSWSGGCVERLNDSLR